MTKRICIFGDSITWGVDDFEMGGWVNRLRHYFDNKVEEKNYFSIYNLGISGNNTDDLIKRFETESKNRKPDIIIFAIGINDSQYIGNKNNPRIRIKKFEKNLNLLINQAKKCSKKIFFLGLTRVVEEKTMPIPWNKGKYYDNENVKKYDNIIKRVTTSHNLRYLNLFNLLNEEELEDGLHPNTAGHEKIFQKVKFFLIDNKIIKI